MRSNTGQHGAQPLAALPAIRAMALSLLGAVVLSSCGQSPAQHTSAGAGGGGTTTAPVSKFDLAGGCYRLRANGEYVLREGNQYLATAANAQAAERFRMQATGLGRYLFFDTQSQILTAVGGNVNASAEAADGSDWVFTGDAGVYNIAVFGQANQRLALDANARLTVAATAANLVFEPADGCAVYPEMPTGISADTYIGPALGEPVIGFAEIHAHMGMGSELSDGSGDVGPSAGGVLYGQAVNRFGVTHALDNCVELHGPDGRLSAENIILDGDPAARHDTQGWPTFIDWPFHDSFLHQQMYWKWVERAWKAGLRVMVMHGTTIEALCNIAKASYGDKMAECVDMLTGQEQVEYMTAVQDYIDAQYGGPGAGWFRIVRSPAEARAVIAEGKLAVMLGYEFSNIWFCRVTFNPDGSEASRDCDTDRIDAEIEKAWQLGIRNVFPYHDIDSALGGTGIFSSVLNYVGFTDTRGFWDTYDCADGGEGDSYFYNAGAELETAALTQFNDPVTQAIIEVNNGALPIYPPGRQCNARTVTDLGAYAINQMMKRGFVIHIDHAEIISKQFMLDEGAKTTPNYPMASGHGGQGGLSNAQAEQMIRQGGIIYPALPNGQDWVAFRDKLKPIWAASGTTRQFAIGYGADANGLRLLPGPRGADREAVQYPFTLFSGPQWGSQFSDAGIQPLTVDMLNIPGGRAWNVAQDGMYHYGLVADIIEEIRIEGDADAITALYRSAEAYLQLWEQTLQASADARAKQLPPGPLPTAP